MANCERGFGEHLAPLPGFQTVDSDSNSSSDSEVEVVSTYDAAEHELVQLGEYLRLGSDSDRDTDAEDEEKENKFPSNSLGSASIHLVSTNPHSPKSMTMITAESNEKQP